MSDDLFDIIWVKEANRGKVVKGLWVYLKKNKLQDPEAKQYFTPDKKMAKVFGTDRMKCFAMSKFHSAHLSDLKCSSVSSTSSIGTKSTTQTPFSTASTKTASHQPSATKTWDAGGRCDDDSKANCSTNEASDVSELSDILYLAESKQQPGLPQTIDVIDILD